MNVALVKKGYMPLAAIDNSTAPRSAGNNGQKASKETRRQQLVEATIDSLAKRGYAETTMADISDGAGMSRGIVNFHFESKDKLLTATLQFLSDEYSAHWRAALDKAGDNPAHQLFALVSCDFDRAICNRRKLAAWCAFWGEAKSRPTYQALCAARDEDYQHLFERLCGALIDDAGYRYDRDSTALGLLALLEGLWHRLMMGGGGLTSEIARQVGLRQLAIVFPHHYAVTETPQCPRVSVISR